MRPILIRGGRVLDPSRGTDEVTDLYLADGKVQASGRNLGRPDDALWATRLERVDALFDMSPDNDVRAHAVAYREAVEAYRREAQSLGDGFVEIQHTTLFATVGQKLAGRAL